MPFCVAERRNERDAIRAGQQQRRKQPRQISKIPERAQAPGGAAPWPAREHFRSEMRSRKTGELRRGVEWEWEWCTYDEAAVELVLEVGADVGVGEEVRRHGGARPVLRPPRVALVVVRRRRRAPLAESVSGTEIHYNSNKYTRKIRRKRFSLFNVPHQ
jgi:hypothetical protein